MKKKRSGKEPKGVFLPHSTADFPIQAHSFFTCREREKKIAKASNSDRLRRFAAHFVAHYRLDCLGCFLFNSVRPPSTVDEEIHEKT